jgi:hypothetical protein
MSNELVSKLWSWSVHTGDPLFAEAAEEIVNLQAEIEKLKPKVFKNEEDRELDIVEELSFFAEACDSEAIVVTMLSGRVFEDAAKEIESLRLLTGEPSMNKDQIVLAQKACQILYWFSRDDYLLTYPERQYDDEIIEKQKIAASMSEHIRRQIDLYFYYQK